MRKSKVEAAETRQQIISVAAEEFRLKGINATGVAPLMAKAGLTHGGFYKHFASKEQLVAEACTVALNGLIEKFESVSIPGGTQGFSSIVESYLSARHKENLGAGCPLAGMGSELVRAADDTRRNASEGFGELVGILAKNINPQSPEEARSQAVFAMAAMVGAVTVSRIIADPQASLSVLQDVRQHLIEI